MSVTLFLVRHGETEENKLRILQGHMPGTLTDEGRMQAGQAGAQLAGEVLDCMYCSDLKRCMDTAEIMNRDLGLPVTYTSLLRERDWGLSTGVSLLKQRVPIDPSAEPVEAMFDRAVEFLNLVMRECPGKRVLVVSHGLFIRILISAIEGVFYKQVVPMSNAEVRRFTLDHLPAKGGTERIEETGATAN